jgi:PIF1-like helicase/Helix-turn-helix domain/HRDC domain/Helicase
VVNSNSIQRNEIFDLAYRFVTETSENIFLTGKAGTGKTTFLKFVKENCSKNIIVAAPTGVAAINAGGVTLHSLFQLPFHPFIPSHGSKEELLSRLKLNKQRQLLLRKMELLIIDEISMVRCDIMDAIDIILRSVRRKHDVAFGGVQLLCIGDLYQLPPVAQHHEWKILQEFYASPFFFDSRVIKEQMPLLIELDTIYRQKEDSFVALLNKVRNNEMMPEDFEALHQRYDPSFRPLFHEKYIALTTHNNQADQVNSRELQKLLEPSRIYEAIIEGDFPENIYPAEGSLVLKKGAQVMFLKNDVILKRYFNGKIGVITSLEDDEIRVDCDGLSISVSPETWGNTRYVLNGSDGKLQQETLGTFSQFPLRLAWAITIHKSQGLTFEKVMIDAGAAFSSGQVYVALSRCTSLGGIVLVSKIPSAAIYSNENITKGQEALTHKGILAERFAGARQIFTQQLLEEIFTFRDVHPPLNALLFHLKEQQDKINQEAMGWADELRNNLLAQTAHGVKFIRQTQDLMKEEPVVEKNAALQKRINDAAGYFEVQFKSCLGTIQAHPLITEHREAATAINEALNQLMTAVHTANYLLQYCRQPFSVTTFLQHKLQFAQPRFNLSCYASGKKQSFTDIPNVELFETLKLWRDQVCEESKMPIYMVANHATLVEIATYLPMNKKDLLQVSGFGKAKVDKFGDDITGAVESYCSRHHLASNMQAKNTLPKKERREKPGGAITETKTVSLNLFKAGKSVTEIAGERNFAVGTIEGHLATFVGSGEIGIDSLLSPKKQQLIRDAIEIHGPLSPKAIFDHLQGQVSYGDIRFMMAAANKK